MSKASSFYLISFYFEYFKVCNSIIKLWVGWLILLNRHCYCHSGKPTPPRRPQECKPTSDGSLLLPELQINWQWFFLPYLQCFWWADINMFYESGHSKTVTWRRGRANYSKHSLCFLVQCPALHGTGDQGDFSHALGEDITWVWQWVRARIMRLQQNKMTGLCLQFFPQSGVSTLWP